MLCKDVQVMRQGLSLYLIVILISDFHAEESADPILHDQYDGHGVPGPHGGCSWRQWRWYGGTGNVLNSGAGTWDLKVPLLHHRRPLYRPVGSLRAPLCEDHWDRWSSSHELCTRFTLCYVLLSFGTSHFTHIVHYWHGVIIDTCICANTLRPRQNYKMQFWNENVRIFIQISLKFVPNGPIGNKEALVRTMAWHQSGDNPLSEPMMA